MNIIKHTASSLFWSYCFHSTLSLSRSLFVCCCCCCWAAAPSVIFLFESYGKTTEPAIYRIHLWWRHAANSSSPLSTSPISFMRICASIRLAHFVASTLFALCVSLSLSDVHPCRAWRAHGIAVQKRNIRGTLRKERLPSNICVYKHILQMQTRPIYDRASCTYSQFHVR